MRLLRKLSFGVWLAVCLIFISNHAFAQTRLMPEDIYSRIVKGYNLMQKKNYAGAQIEFEAVIKVDHDNPFALNNLAAIKEQQGKLQEAEAIMLKAQVRAKDYYDMVDQYYWIGGQIAAVRPATKAMPDSKISGIVAENLLRLQSKLAMIPKCPPPPKSSPAREPKISERNLKNLNEPEVEDLTASSKERTIFKQFEKGVMYYKGQGVTQDYAKAKEWFEKAAAQGNAAAQAMMGLMYDQGQGVVRDSAKARHWNEKAAAQGNAVAKEDLRQLEALK
jgi:tetratricopeptide (TPR) repeat protein